MLLRPSAVAPVRRAVRRCALSSVNLRFSSFAALGITSSELLGQLQRLGVTSPSEVQAKVRLAVGGAPRAVTNSAWH